MSVSKACSIRTTQGRRIKSRFDKNNAKAAHQISKSVKILKKILTGSLGAAERAQRAEQHKGIASNFKKCQDFRRKS